MKTFNNMLGKPVQVTDPDDDRSQIKGNTGVVVRLLKRSSEEAWVRMDQPLPDELRRFHVDDDRADHICLWADEVEAIA